jgi:tRNA-specific 2-thiouridylase
MAAKTRYRQSDAPCNFMAQGRSPSEGFRLDFTDAQWAVTPGQSAVLYDGEVCLGGGVINSAQVPAVVPAQPARKGARKPASKHKGARPTMA